MKDTKKAKIDFRVTPEEKEKIKEFAKAHDMTVGEFVRWACEKIFYKEKQE